MLTKDIRTTIDNARDILVGKIPNPQSQIEQITTAMIYKFMDDMDLESVEFGGERTFFKGDLEQYSWSKLMSVHLGVEARMNLYTEALEKLPLSTQIPDLFRQIFKGAYLPFRDAQTLTLFLKEINELTYDNSENLGNAFEYLLSIMGSQGDAGQFRTPRHIIDFIVDVVNPQKSDTILDPACGTAGFLISAYKHILSQNTENRVGDKLTPEERINLTQNINGYDISPEMEKLGLVNLYLHGFKNPKIYEYDTLTKLDKWDEYYDVVLANPPFMTPKGGIKPHNKFGIKANRSEVLFVDYIMEHLNTNGRAGVIVPEGIVFQSANAYKALRKKLVQENYLYAVVRLPSGVFQPYSGVKTSILLFDRQIAKRTDEILFVSIQNDGYDLGAQRREIDKNDLPEAIKIIRQWQNAVISQDNETIKAIKENSFATVVEKTTIAQNGEFNLTASRYTETKDYSDCKWDMVKLGDVCELKRGFAFKSEDYIDNGILNFRVTNIGENGEPTLKDAKYLPEYFLDKYKDYQLEDGDFLIVMVGATTGKMGYITKDILPALLNQNMWKFVADEKLINKKYLYYMMKQGAILQKQGGARDYLKQADFIVQKIPLPPLEVQEEIVKELDAYQAIIDGAKKVVENWKPTLPINPNWKKVKLGDVCETTSGGTPLKSNNEYYTPEEIPWINSGEVRNGEIFAAKKYISSLGLEKSSAKLVPANSVLVAMYGATAGQVGILKFEASTNQAICSILPNDKFSPKFLYYILSAQTENLIKMSVGGAQPNISQAIIKSIEILLPPINEQKEIIAKIEEEEKAVEQCKKLIELHQQKITDKIQSIWGDACE